MMIETKRLTKSFGKLVAVNNLDLKVKKGEIHGFVGPNGAGKSTTLKLLVGAIKCTDGEGIVGGYPLGSKEVRRLIGYSPERPAFYGDMIAWDYMVHMAGLSGMPIDRAEIKTHEILDWLELSDFIDTQVGGFSAGMKQRLSLAQAMIHEPELLILDEPTANLDPTGRISLLEKLKQLPHERSITIFISSHILSELEYLVDSVTFIDKGQAVIEDTVQQLKQDMSLNHYVLNTTNNEFVFKELQGKDSVQEITLDNDGIIHLLSDDMSVLQAVVMETVIRGEAMIKYFGKEQVKLEDIYRKTVGQDKN